MSDVDAKSVDPYPRLEPTPTTIKELFAKSGNQCAYSGCLAPVVDEQGNVVAQIAHIKGVRPESPRFDSSQTPEDRRQPNNLLILCYPHHKATNDEKLYPVSEMNSIKDVHESRFSGLVSGLQGTFEDQTVHTVARPPETMKRYGEVFGLSDEEAADVREQYVTMLNHLAKLPPDARSVLATIINRANGSGPSGWTREGSFGLPIAELRDVLGVDDFRLREQLAILKHNDLVDVDAEGTEESLGTPVALAYVGVGGCDDYLFTDLKTVAAANAVTVHRALVQLDFRLLDHA